MGDDADLRVAWAMRRTQYTPAQAAIVVHALADAALDAAAAHFPASEGYETRATDELHDHDGPRGRLAARRAQHHADGGPRRRPRRLRTSGPRARRPRVALAPVVPDVESFPGHIACSATTRSEIVVPLLRAGGVISVLDVDSNAESAFDEVDQQALESICESPAARFGASP